MNPTLKVILSAQEPIIAAQVAAEKRIAALENGSTAQQAEQAALNVIRMADSFARDTLAVGELPHLRQRIAVVRAWGYDLSKHLPEVA